jgi:hypothetical protein
MSRELRYKPGVARRRPNPVSCRLSCIERAAVVAIAWRRGLTVSALIKEALQPHLVAVDRVFTPPSDFAAPRSQSSMIRTKPVQQSSAAASGDCPGEIRGGFRERLK